MRKIQLRDAKAKFSALVTAAAQGEPALITRHGRAAAVIIGMSEWERLTRQPAFGRQLMAEKVEEDVPQTRDQMKVAG